MSHKGIRLLIEDTATKLGNDIQFTYARKSDFNVMSGKRYPFIVLDPLSSAPQYAVNNTSNYTKTWNCSMAFYQIDSEASIANEYAIILDEVDFLVDSFIQKLNFFTQIDTLEDTIVITSINQSPFIKATADILTGFLLTFQILVPDDWNYCLDGC